MKLPENSRLAWAVLGAGALLAGFANAAIAADKLKADMFSDGQVTPKELVAAKAGGANATVLQLDGREEADRQNEVAARLIQKVGLDLHYWIEIGRCPELADAHPEWMASLQGHTQWRRFFKDVPRPIRKAGVIKNYSWVSILYKEFPRDLRLYGKRAGWIPHALATFQTMPPAKGGKAVATKRLIPVLQGWDVTEADITAQKKRAEESGASDFIVSRAKIDQGWVPRLYKLPQ